MSDKVKRPAPFKVGDVRASVRAKRGERDGQWYWRAVTGSRADLVVVWSGWATRVDAQDRVTGLVTGRLRANADLVDVRDLMEAYVWHIENERQDLATGTLQSRRVCGEHLATRIGREPLDGLGAGGLERYRDQRLAAGAAPRTVEKELRALSYAWTWAWKRGLVQRPLDLPKVRIAGFVYNHRTPTPREVQQVLAAMRRRRAKWAPVVLSVLYGTGARVGEVASLRRAAVDLKAGTLLLQGKTGSRVVPTAAGLTEQLAGWLEGFQGDGLIWGHRSAKYVTSGFYTVLAGACRDAGVPAFTAHGLRRLAVDRLARAKVDPSVAARLLGHSPEVMLRLYRSVTEDDLRDAVQTAGLSDWPLEFK